MSVAGQRQAMVLSNCNLCCFNKVMFPTLNSNILFVVFSALLLHVERETECKVFRVSRGFHTLQCFL